MAEKTIGGVLRSAITRLSAVSDNARIDAEVLLAHILECGRGYLRANADAVLDGEAVERFESMIARRIGGEPIAYLLGEREFWSMALAVSPQVLIPRPDTETLVHAALEVTADREDSLAVADLGTGSGAIAIAMAAERPEWRILATDIHEHALKIARGNAHRLGIHNIGFRQGDWLHALPDEEFDLIVSNPPYIPDDDVHLAQGDVRFEPRDALASGPEGLDALRAIIFSAGMHLKPGGWLLLEHGFDQSPAVTELLTKAKFTDITHWRDLGGHIRVSGGSLPDTM